MFEKRGLRERFEDFISTFDGFESIDSLLKGRDPSDMKRADYLFSDRSIILEQKTLISDPSDKPHAFVESLIAEGRFIFWGTRRRLPDGEQLKARMFDSLTKQLDAVVALADKQTRDTRTIFEIPNALGILIILNESAKTLTPDIIRYGIQRPFAKRISDGTFRYPHNQGAMVLSEIHPLVGNNGTTLYPIMPFFRHGHEMEQQFNAFCRKLMLDWALFNGAPLIRGDQRPDNSPENSS